jgi:dienelactone hydrolase
MTRSWQVLLLFVCLALMAKYAPAAAVDVGDKFAAADSLSVGEETNTDAKDCLAGLAWAPGKFTVHLEPAEPGCGDWLVRFPSPRPIGNAKNDLVSMEWYAPRDKQGEIRRARAIVVVHESGRSMTVGRLIARGLNGAGLHAFLIQLPGYGARRVEGQSAIERTLPALQQAIADVRRARDAVVALPVVDGSVAGVQGTSLGGFVTATVAGLDRGYDRAFILLAGGNLHDVILHGSKDAAKTREKLKAAGVTEEQIRAAARLVEPMRLAHRIDPAGTWLYRGEFDEVVPPSCSLALVQAARLPADHVTVLPVTHYSGIIYLPRIVQEIYGHMAEPAADRESRR